MASLVTRLTGENHSCQALKVWDTSQTNGSSAAHCFEVVQKGKNRPFYTVTKTLDLVSASRGG